MNRSLIFLRTLALNTLFYAGVGYLPFLEPTEIGKIPLDDHIAFTPYAVYPYFSFFFMIWYAIASAERQEDAEELSILIPTSAFLASIIFLTFPMVVSSPPFDMGGSDRVTSLIFDLMRADRSLTYMPSLHGAITAICVPYLGQGKSPARKVFLVAWGLSICWSAIALRQHLSMDIIAGVVFGLMILLGKRPILRVVPKLARSVLSAFGGVRFTVARDR